MKIQPSLLNEMTSIISYCRDVVELWIESAGSIDLGIQLRYLLERLALH
jgi:hypothetical protein